MKILIVCFVSLAVVAYLAKSHADDIANRNREIAVLKTELVAMKVAHPVNGTLAQQAECAAKAELELRKNGGAAHDATKVLVNTAVGHYNATLNRCLIRSQMTTQAPDGMTMWFISVKDAFDGKEFASEITQRAHLNGSTKANVILACHFTNLEGTDTSCTDDAGTFESGVDRLMEGAAKW